LLSLKEVKMSTNNKLAHYSNQLTVGVTRSNESTRVTNNNGLIELYSNEDAFVRLGESTTLSTGVSLTLPPGTIARIENKNTLLSMGLIVGNTVLSSGQTEEIKVVLHNLTNQSYSGSQGIGYDIRKGEKIAQVVLQPSFMVRLIEDDNSIL
jgi:dUTPase